TAPGGSMEAALDTRCPVCLDNWDSVAYAMPCCHQFCFPCIQRWTSTRPQCPLCKQGVWSIIHTTRADDWGRAAAGTHASPNGPLPSVSNSTMQIN
uniref:RING-type E3 ubiquitin transferase n=1 Tax=Meleagris gallopavo TaxID=9103 RepID=A0A803XX08_MELGA